MASSTFFIPSVNVIGADSLTDAMNMMADYGFTRTLIVTDNTLTKLGSDSNLLIVFYVQIMPDDLVMQLHRF